MKTEFVIWGKSPLSNYEDAPLYTRAASMDEAKRIQRILERDHQCHSTRIQVLNPADDLADTWRNAAKA